MQSLYVMHSGSLVQVFNCAAHAAPFAQVLQVVQLPVLSQVPPPDAALLGPTPTLVA